jgi:hypothetical protein
MYQIKNIKRITGLLSITTIIILMSMSLNNDKPRLKKRKEITKEGKLILSYYIDKKITERLRFTKDGIRDGLSEYWKEEVEIMDGSQIKVMKYIASMYDKGKLMEESVFNEKNILLNKTVFSMKNFDYVLMLTEIDNNRDFHYRKIKYNNCGFIQYNLINEDVIDSLIVRY